MDENGAVKFPANQLQAVVKNARALQVEEEARMSALRQATSAAEIKAILAGHAYARPEQAQR
jgi:regulator of RNase E activity RraA